MLSQPGRGRYGWRGWGSVRPRRPGERLSLSLEVLEPRLLMASSPMNWGELVRGQELTSRLDLTTPALELQAEYAPSHVPVDETGGDQYSSPDDGIGPPSSAPYLVVPETPDFHGTISTAQVIPDVPYAGVLGMLAPGRTIDLYRLDLGTGTLALRLAVGYDGTSTPLRLWVFNQSGQVIAVGTTSNGMVDLTVAPGHSGLAADSPVFVGVDAAGPGATLPEVGYQLWFLRVPETVGSLTDFGAESAAQPGESLGTLALIPSGSIPFTAGNGTSSGSGIPFGPSALASAQSPSLTAAPSGGVLTDGTAALTVAMATPTVTDLETPSAFLAVAEPSSMRSDARSSDGGAATASSLLVTIPGPGGSPSLAGATVGDWQGESDGAGESAIDDRLLVRITSPMPHACHAAAFPVILAVAAIVTAGE